MSFLETVVKFGEEAEQNGYKLIRYSPSGLKDKTGCFIDIAYHSSKWFKKDFGGIEFLGMILPPGWHIGFCAGMGDDLEKEIANSEALTPEKIQKIRSKINTPDYHDGKNFAELLCKEWVARGHKFHD